MANSPQDSSPVSRWPMVVLILRVLLGLFFLYSGGVKVFVVGLSAFVESVGNYQLVGAPWDAVVGYVLPWVEISAGLALMFGVASRGASVVVIGMLLFFCIALAMAWASGLEINCGCHGKSEDPTNYLLKILSNLGLVLVAVISLLGHHRPWRREGPSASTALPSKS